MKLVAIFLALAAVAGAQASYLSDEPRPRLEQINDAIQDYFDKISERATQNIDSIRNSELGKEINSRITDTINSARNYQAELQQQLPPAAQQLVQQIFADLQELSEKVQPLTEHVKQKLQGRVSEMGAGLAPYAEDLLERAEQHSETLRHHLSTRTEELRQRLQKNMGDLQGQVGPYAEELKAKFQQHFQEFQEGVETYAQQMQKGLSQVRPYAEDLHERLVPLAKELPGRLRSLWASIVERLQ